MNHSKQKSKQQSTRSLLTAACFLFVLVCCASFFPDRRLWGFNHLAYYSMPVRLAALAVIALFFLPKLSRWTFCHLTTFARILLEKSTKGRIIRSCVLTIALILFISFQSSTLLLGDGRYMATNMRLATENDAYSLSQFLKTVTLNEHIYPGTLFLYFVAASARIKIEDSNPLAGIRIFISLLGVLFILSLLHFAPRNRAPDNFYVLLFLLILFSGGIELFFGYVESYAPAALAGMLYIFTAWRSLSGKAPLWHPFLSLIVACTLHILCLLLVPSCIYLVAYHLTDRNQKRHFARIAVTIAVAMIAGVSIASRLPPLSRYFLPLRITDASYGIFSPAHLIDIFNQIFLIFPASLFCVFIAILKRGQNAGEDRIAYAFVLLLLLPSTLFLFLFKPELGMARDWDLFSLISFGLIPFAAFILKSFYSNSGDKNLLIVTASPVLMISMVLTIAWIGINADESKSVARFENILEYDRTHAGYTYENLALHFRDAGDLDRTIEALEKAYTASGNPRFISNLGQLYFQQGDTLKALEAYRECLRKTPEYEIGRANFIHLLSSTGRLDELIEVCIAGAELYPANPYYPFWIGQSYFLKGMFDEQIKAFQRCRQLNPPAGMLDEMDRLERAAFRLRKHSHRSNLFPGSLNHVQ